LAVRSFFNNCEIFKTLLKSRDAETPTLKDVVCKQFNDAQIRKVETAFILSASKQFPFIKAKLETEWPNFVIHLTKVVWTSYQKENDAEIDARLRALRGFSTEPAPSKTPAQASRPQSNQSNPMIQSPMEYLSPVVVPGPQLPEGWMQSGPPERPIYFNRLTGKGQYEYPSMPSRELELAQRLEQIRDPDYTPPLLTERDQESAKRVGAWLPDIKKYKEVSAYDRLMALNLDD
jgi:hypothetical protein